MNRRWDVKVRVQALLKTHVADRANPVVWVQLPVAAEQDVKIPVIRHVKPSVLIQQRRVLARLAPIVVLLTVPTQPPLPPVATVQQCVPAAVLPVARAAGHLALGVAKLPVQAVVSNSAPVPPNIICSF